MNEQTTTALHATALLVSFVFCVLVVAGGFR